MEFKNLMQFIYRCSFTAKVRTFGAIEGFFWNQMFMWLTFVCIRKREISTKKRLFDEKETFRRKRDFSTRIFDFLHFLKYLRIQVFFAIFTNKLSISDHTNVDSDFVKFQSFARNSYFSLCLPHNSSYLIKLNKNPYAKM